MIWAGRKRVPLITGPVLLILSPLIRSWRSLILFLFSGDKISKTAVPGYEGKLLSQREPRDINKAALPSVVLIGCYYLVNYLLLGSLLDNNYERVKQANDLCDENFSCTLSQGIVISLSPSLPRNLLREGIREINNDSRAREVLITNAAVIKMSCNSRSSWAYQRIP